MVRQELETKCDICKIHFVRNEEMHWDNGNIVCNECWEVGTESEFQESWDDRN